MERALPNVSLFAANGVYGDALAYRMSDVTENGTPCDYNNPDNVVYNSAGVTSFGRTVIPFLGRMLNRGSESFDE
jgi:hypothetical protein